MTLRHLSGADIVKHASVLVFDGDDGQLPAVINGKKHPAVALHFGRSSVEVVSFVTADCVCDVAYGTVRSVKTIEDTFVLEAEDFVVSVRSSDKGTLAAMVEVATIRRFGEGVSAPVDPSALDVTPVPHSVASDASRVDVTPSSMLAASSGGKFAAVPSSSRVSYAGAVAALDNFLQGTTAPEPTGGASITGMTPPPLSAVAPYSAVPALNDSSHMVRARNDTAIDRFFDASRSTAKAFPQAHVASNVAHSEAKRTKREVDEALEVQRREIAALRSLVEAGVAPAQPTQGSVAPARNESTVVAVDAGRPTADVFKRTIDFGTLLNPTIGETPRRGATPKAMPSSVVAAAVGSASSTPVAPTPLPAPEDATQRTLPRTPSTRSMVGLSRTQSMERLPARGVGNSADAVALETRSAPAPAKATPTATPIATTPVAARTPSGHSDEAPPPQRSHTPPPEPAPAPRTVAPATPPQEGPVTVASPQIGRAHV